MTRGELIHFLLLWLTIIYGSIKRGRLEARVEKLEGSVDPPISGKYAPGCYHQFGLCMGEFFPAKWEDPDDHRALRGKVVPLAPPVGPVTPVIGGW